MRDGGVPGVVIRLGRGFGEVKVEDGSRVRAGTAVPDVKVSRAAQEAAIAGLAFFRGIPGAIGGALRMNGGAYGRETKDALIEARGVDRQGRVRVFSNGDMHYTYRHCGAPDDIIFTQALFQGAPGDPREIAAEMDKITESREATQPIKSRTGGSTFKNPPGHKAWQLIDAAGCRGLKVGDAQVSQMHCNFLINLGSATAVDIETLGRDRARARGGEIPASSWNGRSSASGSRSTDGTPKKFQIRLYCNGKFISCDFDTASCVGRQRVRGRPCACALSGMHRSR